LGIDHTEPAGCSAQRTGLWFSDAERIGDASDPSTAVAWGGRPRVEGLFFFWYLREYLCDVASNRRLATLAFAGVILFAVSGALQAGLRLSMADAVDHVDPGVLQALNVLQNDLHTVMGGAGVAVFLVATGIAVIRNGPLPTWLGWAGVVLGVAGAVLGAPAAALWIVISSIVILVRAGRPEPVRAS